MINDGVTYSIKKSQMIDAITIVRVIIKKNKIIKNSDYKELSNKNFQLFLILNDERLHKNWNFLRKQ